MHVVLWDTRRAGVTKDFAAGLGVRQDPGLAGVRGWVLRGFFRRDHPPVPLLMAHLSAIFTRLGHRVEYAADRFPRGADLYVFCPALATLDIERRAIERLRQENPAAGLLVVGLTATVLPDQFRGPGVTVVEGEAEQLLWRLDEVLARPGEVVNLGLVKELDRLPLPDWSPFRPQRFRVPYDFWRFPTAFIEASRGCRFACDYCPYIILDRGLRCREPEAVAEEIHDGVRRWGFRSFKFRDPLFGANAAQAFRLADLIGRLSEKIQFSIETRAELMRPEMLRILRRVGLTCVTLGVETPGRETLRRHGRTPSDGPERELIAACRRLGIRTIAGFLIGFPDDTPRSIERVLRYAQELNPTLANFNILTPYPGTEFSARSEDRIADHGWARYTAYTPLLRYEHLTAAELQRLHADCFNRFYFRVRYLRDNAHLLWPRLRRLGLLRRSRSTPGAEPPHSAVPRPAAGLDLLRRKGLRQDAPHRRK